MSVRVKLFFFTLAVAISFSDVVAQETVFALLKRDTKLADTYFEQKNFNRALSLYLNTLKRSSLDPEVNVKIARCYYFLKQYARAVEKFAACVKSDRMVESSDLYYYAEALSATAQYKMAVEVYKRYLTRVPDDQLVVHKIWRLNNIQFLYEDSLHYAVRPVSINSEFGELCPVPYPGGLIFISNRKEVQMVEKVDASLNTPFYRMYYTATAPDTLSNGMFMYGRPVAFGKQLYSGFHTGPVAVYQQGKQMVFASTGKVAESGGRTLGLFFAGQQKNETFKITNAFPYNSAHHSISDPSINEEGTTLYFSSDMKGGTGGKDIYRSTFKNGQWTKPENLGEGINTAHDEVFPYLHQGNTLYFSSNGLAGLGGLDIFKAQLKGPGFEEPQNAGYPINTNADEFGISIDSLSRHGYFSSNRRQGGFNDDIYEFDMDLQTYPLTISGLIHVKEQSWSDSSALKLFQNAKLHLVDNLRNVVVYENTSDDAGNFSLSIPYYSKYRIEITGKENDLHVVSLEIPKHRKLHSNYEIVVVRDVFRSPQN